VAGAFTTGIKEAITLGNIYGFIGFDPYSYSFNINIIAALVEFTTIKEVEVIINMVSITIGHLLLIVLILYYKLLRILLL
jgi:hypothetical protein